MCNLTFPTWKDSSLYPSVQLGDWAKPQQSWVKPSYEMWWMLNELKGSTQLEISKENSGFF